MEKKKSQFLNGIRSQNSLSRFFVSFQSPAFTAALSHMNGLFISLIPLPYTVFLLHELVLGDHVSGLQNWENAADPSHGTSFPRGPFVSVAAHTGPPTAEACFSPAS